MITLKNVLLINAVSSGATGLILVAAPKMFATIFKVQASSPFVGIGLFLMAFAMTVFVVSRMHRTRPSFVIAVIAVDSIWVIVSIIGLVIDPYHISFFGKFMIGAVAAWVLMMAVLQSLGLKVITVSKANKI